MNPVDKLHMQLTTLSLATSRRFLRMMDVRLADFAVTSATVVPLLLVGRSGGGINQVTLADQIGVVGPSLVRTIDKLVELDLLRREQDPDDRRARTLWLTDKGAALTREVEGRLVHLRREVLGQLPVEDIQAALRVHQAMNAALVFDGSDDADA